MRRHRNSAGGVLRAGDPGSKASMPVIDLVPPVNGCLMSRRSELVPLGPPAPDRARILALAHLRTQPPSLHTADELVPRGPTAAPPFPDRGSVPATSGRQVVARIAVKGLDADGWVGADRTASARLRKSWSPSSRAIAGETAECPPQCCRLEPAIPFGPILFAPALRPACALQRRGADESRRRAADEHYNRAVSTPAAAAVP